MSEIQSLARGLRALDILEAESEGIGVTGIARRIDVDKSTASRIMKTLANYGYAEQSGETRRYTLGPRLVRLGQSSADTDAAARSGAAFPARAGGADAGVRASGRARQRPRALP